MGRKGTLFSHLQFMVQSVPPPQIVIMPGKGTRQLCCQGPKPECSVPPPLILHLNYCIHDAATLMQATKWYLICCCSRVNVTIMDSQTNQRQLPVLQVVSQSARHRHPSHCRRLGVSWSRPRKAWNQRKWDASTLLKWFHTIFLHMFYL